MQHDHPHQDHTHKKHHTHKIGHSHDRGGSVIDFYATNSKLRFLSPGYKAGISLIALLLCLILNNPLISLILTLVPAIILIKVGGLDFHSYLSVLTIPIAFILIGSITVAIDFSSEPIGDLCNLNLHWGYLYLSKSSALQAVFLILRVFGAVSCMFFMTLSTPAHELFSLMGRLPIPQLFTELTHMVYRYIFILLDVQRSMRISAESRLGFCDFKTSISSFGLIAANLFIVALKKANRSFEAMEARCYDGTLAFWEEEKTTNPVYYIFAALFFSALIALWFFTRRLL